MTDQPSVPDYALPDSVELREPAQYRALFDDVRTQIVEMLSERAATVSQLADALGRPKGTVGHHVGVLEQAGLVHVVRTERVRAIEAKYYGRTARTFLFSSGPDTGLAPDFLLTRAAAELAGEAATREGRPMLSTLRHARIPDHRAKEFNRRLVDLVDEFASSARGGDVVYGLAVALYPTDRPHLGAGERES